MTCGWPQSGAGVASTFAGGLRARRLSGISCSRGPGGRILVPVSVSGPDPPARPPDSGVTEQGQTNRPAADAYEKRASSGIIRLALGWYERELFYHFRPWTEYPDPLLVESQRINPDQQFPVAVPKKGRSGLRLMDCESQEQSLIQMTSAKPTTRCVIDRYTEIAPGSHHYLAARGCVRREWLSGSVGRSTAKIAVLMLICSSMWLAGCDRARGTPAPQPQAPSAADCCVDANGNGLPDSAELHSFNDRENFRRWFTWIAESQFYQTSEAWNLEQRDCAGLVRFAMREALRQHDRAWFQRIGSLQGQVAPDVRAYSLESGPLGERLFRTDFGSFKPGDVSGGKFSEYADGRTLKNYNCTFVSRERTAARPGDLLFFYQPWVQHYPYHVMIFIGEAKAGADKGRDWVVYHTGSSPSDKGTVKKARLGVLDHHPDNRWRPVLTNPNFLGFYRLKILD